MNTTPELNEAAEGGSSPTAGYAIFHGRGGYECERKRASETLEVGKSYKVTGGTEHSSVTYIELEGIKGDWNTAMFDCDRETLPFTRMADRYILPHNAELRDRSGSGTPPQNQPTKLP